MKLEINVYIHCAFQVYKAHFSNNVNASNLAGLVEQYIWRTDINLTRDITEKNTLSCPVLNLVGIHAANAIVDETVTFNGRLTPTKANWIKIQVSRGIMFGRGLRIGKIISWWKGVERIA